MATIQIADNDARKQYTQAVTANTTQLVIDFPFFSLDDIEVRVVDENGLLHTPSRGTGADTFAVVGTAVDDGFSGGYVTLGDTYTSSSTSITIFRDITASRTTDFPTSGPFNIAALNTELDKTMALIQQNETSVNRALRLSDEDTSTSATLPTATNRSNKYLGFDTNGNPIASAGTADGTPINAAMQAFVQSSNVTDARALLLAGSQLTIPSGGFDTTLQSTGDIQIIPGTNNYVEIPTDGQRYLTVGDMRLNDNVIRTPAVGTDMRISSGADLIFGVSGAGGTAQTSETAVNFFSFQGVGGDYPCSIELVGGKSGGFTTVGQIEFVDRENNTGSKTCATIKVTNPSGGASNATGGNIVFGTQPTGGGGVTDHVTINSEGRLSVSTIENGEIFTVQNTHNGTLGGPSGMRIDFALDNPDNNSSFFIKAEDSTTARFYVYSDGDVQNHDNSYSGISDSKLKQQIADASSQWDDIKALQIRKFKFNSDVTDKGDSDSLWRLGVIAQKVESAGMNGLVYSSPDVDDDGNDLGTETKAVKYSILYMKAVKALQEAMTKIEALEARVTTLENA